MLVTGAGDEFQQTLSVEETIFPYGILCGASFFDMMLFFHIFLSFVAEEEVEP